MYIKGIWASTMDFGSYHKCLGTLGINFACSLHLCPFLVCVCSEGSGESAHMRRLAFAIAAR